MSSTADVDRLLAILKGQTEGDGETAEILAAAVLRKNRENALQFAQTPYSERAVFVAQCLRSTSSCRAEQRGKEYLCRGCGACKIAEIAGAAEKLGYMSVRILKGGSALARLVAEIRPKAVLGICCCMEGVMGIMACERAGVPAFCVPLLRSGCADTDVDLDDVRAALEALTT